VLGAGQPFRAEHRQTRRTRRSMQLCPAVFSEEGLHSYVPFGFGLEFGFCSKASEFLPF